MYTLVSQYQSTVWSSINEQHNTLLADEAFDQRQIFESIRVKSFVFANFIPQNGFNVFKHCV